MAFAAIPAFPEAAKTLVLDVLPPNPYPSIPTAAAEPGESASPTQLKDVPLPPAANIGGHEETLSTGTVVYVPAGHVVVNKNNPLSTALWPMANNYFGQAQPGVQPPANEKLSNSEMFQRVASICEMNREKYGCDMTQLTANKPWKRGNPNLLKEGQVYRVTPDGNALSQAASTAVAASTSQPTAEQPVQPEEKAPSTSTPDQPAPSESTSATPQGLVAPGSPPPGLHKLPDLDLKGLPLERQQAIKEAVAKAEALKNVVIKLDATDPLRASKLREAYRGLDQAYQQVPDSFPQAHQTKTWLLLNIGDLCAHGERWDAASVVYHSALNEAKEVPSARLHYLVMERLLAGNDKEGALNELNVARQLLANDPERLAKAEARYTKIISALTSPAPSGTSSSAEGQSKADAGSSSDEAGQPGQSSVPAQPQGATSQLAASPAATDTGAAPAQTQGAATVRSDPRLSDEMEGILDGVIPPDAPPKADGGVEPAAQPAAGTPVVVTPVAAASAAPVDAAAPKQPLPVINLSTWAQGALSTTRWGLSTPLPANRELASDLGTQTRALRSEIIRNVLEAQGSINRATVLNSTGSDLSVQQQRTRFGEAYLKFRAMYDKIPTEMVHHRTWAKIGAGDMAFRSGKLVLARLIYQSAANTDGRTVKDPASHLLAMDRLHAVGDKLAAGKELDRARELALPEDRATLEAPYRNVISNLKPPK